MSEAGLWLNYCLSAVVACAIIYFRKWLVVPAMLLGSVASVAIWLSVSLARGGNFDDPWFEIALVINGSFALIFAAVGAAAGRVMISSRET